MRYPSLLLFLVFLGACQGGSSKEKTQAEEPAAAGEIYPGVPQEVMQRLWDSCDYIDYIFYDLDFSMSQDRQGSIRQALQHISREAAPVAAGCRPAGRIFYQAQGEILLEADLFFDTQCQFMVFYEKGKKAYANYLTPAGLQFFQNAFTQIQQN